MESNPRKSSAALLAMAAGLFVSAPFAQAGSPSTGTKEEIARVLHTIIAGVQQGDSVVTMSHKLYAENVIIIGEGTPGSTQGLSEAEKDTQGFWDSLGPNGQKGCSFRMVDPGVASKETYTSFLILTCKANPPTLSEPLTLRLLYAWKKLPQGWRVVLEVWGTGTIDKSSGITDVPP